MSKNCIFDKDKICDNCGECDRCDLDKNKKCNNCGKCLEMEGCDSRAIKIDEIFDDEEDSKDYEKIGDIYVEDHDHEHEHEDKMWDYIDDIKDLKDLIKEEKSEEGNLHEEFPGLFTLKEKNKNN